MYSIEFKIAFSSVINVFKDELSEQHNTNVRKLIRIVKTGEMNMPN